MSANHSQTNQPGRNRERFSVVGDGEDAWESILRDLLGTQAGQRAIFTAVPLALDAWAGTSRWKQPLSRLIGSLVGHSAARAAGKPGGNEMAALFQDENFVRKVLEILPAFADACSRSLCAAGKGLAAIPAKERKAVVEKWFTATDRAGTGMLLTDMAQLVSEMNREDSQWLASVLRPGLMRWLSSVDLGEVKEAAGSSRETMSALAEMVNDVIWQYPAKVIAIFSLLPDLVNMAAGSTEKSLEKLNDIPPDLITDIVASLLLEMDAAVVAGVLNQLAEIGRKVVTGSALLGEPGSPYLPKVLSDVLDKWMSELDAQTIWKGRIAFEALKASWQGARMESLQRNPDDFRQEMMGRAEIGNIHADARNQWMARLESLDEEELAGILMGPLTIADTQAAVDTINMALRIFNPFWERKPEYCSDMIDQFVQGLDVAELATAAEHVLEDAGDALRPAARSVVPGLVTWVCAVLQPADDEHEEAAARAREALGRLLKRKEV